MSPEEALQRLQEGNRRFVSGRVRSNPDRQQRRRLELVAGQDPFAIVLGCSDSRVPAELIFDQGIGDLFVIRVAGNIAAPSQLGSIEFAAQTYDTSLLVVLGHTGCGAVAATVDNLTDSPAQLSPNLEEVASRIRPAVQGLLAVEPGMQRALLAARAVVANVRTTSEQLAGGSEVVARRVRDGRLTVVGAVYSMESGTVRFLA